jgi:hypothetical protein
MEIMITFCAFGMLMLMMALGVMFTGRPLKGSCGGVGGECPCEDSGTPGTCKIPEDRYKSESNETQLVGETSDGVKLYS